MANKKANERTLTGTSAAPELQDALQQKHPTKTSKAHPLACMCPLGPLQRAETCIHIPHCVGSPMNSPKHTCAEHCILYASRSCRLNQYGSKRDWPMLLYLGSAARLCMSSVVLALEACTVFASSEEPLLSTNRNEHACKLSGIQHLQAIPELQGVAIQKARWTSEAENV